MQLQFATDSIISLNIDSIKYESVSRYQRECSTSYKEHPEQLSFSYDAMSNQRLRRSDSVLVYVVLIKKGPPLIKYGPPLIKEVGPSQRRDHHGHDTECNQWLR